MICWGLLAAKCAVSCNGKTRTFLLLTVFFLILVEIIWYIATVCYPVSITVHSTCASSHSWSLHSPIHSQCPCICPCRHYPVFIFCWLLNHYWAANLQIMPYRMPVYQKYFTIYNWSCQSGIYICINSLWSYVLFPTFFIKNITFKGRCSF